MAISVDTEIRCVRMMPYIVLLVLVWAIVICASLMWNLLEGRQEVLSMARIQAQVAYQRDVIYRRWNAEHGGVYVPMTEKAPPNSYLDVMNRDFRDSSGRSLTLMNPAYMTRQVHELAREAYGIHGHITSLNPIRPENAPGPWETQALQAFEQGEKEVSEIKPIDGKSHMRLMRPLMTEEGCLKCHEKQGYKVGDVRGGISVAVPMEPLWNLEGSRMLGLAGGHGLIWLLGMVGITLGSRRLGHQIDERRRAEEKVRQSEAELRVLNEQLERAKELLKQSFERYVSAQIVDEIMQSTQPVNLRGERKKVTILLSDIRGFTALSEQMSSEDLVQFLNIYFSAMIDIVFANEGAIDKFMGDAVLALFGAPLSHEDDSLRAVKAALAMQEKLRELNQQWGRGTRPDIRVGIGISTGEVVVGNIGSAKRLEYTAIGQDVNYAQRVEELTKEFPADILVTEATYQEIRNHVVAQKFGPIAIRGKETPIYVYGIERLAGQE